MRYKISKRVGEKIARIRKRQKTTQEELAEKVKIHVSSLGRIERGEASPNLPMLEKIARQLKVKVAELLP